MDSLRRGTRDEGHASIMAALHKYTVLLEARFEREGNWRLTGCTPWAVKDRLPARQISKSRGWRLEFQVRLT